MLLANGHVVRLIYFEIYSVTANKISIQTKVTQDHFVKSRQLNIVLRYLFQKLLTAVFAQPKAREFKLRWRQIVSGRFFVKRSAFRSENHGSISPLARNMFVPPPQGEFCRPN
jgi:hypothetical protein